MENDRQINEEIMQFLKENDQFVYALNHVLNADFLDYKEYLNLVGRVCGYQDTEFKLRGVPGVFLEILVDYVKSRDADFAAYYATRPDPNLADLLKSPALYQYFRTVMTPPT